MSSHREAPEISKDPVADSTDVYAFVSPDRPDTVTIIANYIPLEDPAGGPNFFEFGDDVLYRINVDNNGDGRADIIYEFDVHDAVTQPEHVPLQHGADRLDRRPQLQPAADLHGHRGPRRRTCACSVSNLPCPPCNVGPRSTPNYASTRQLRDLRRPRRDQVFAGQRLDGFYVDLGAVFDLGRAAAVPEPPPHPDARPRRANALAAFNVHTHRDPGPDHAAHPRRVAPDRSDGETASIGVWASAHRQKALVREDGRTSARSVRAGVATRQPADQRGHHPDGPQGRVEPRRAGPTTRSYAQVRRAAGAGDAAAGPLPRCVPQPRRRHGRSGRPARDPADRHPSRASSPGSRTSPARRRPTCSGSTWRSPGGVAERERDPGRRPRRLPERPPSVRRRRHDRAAAVAGVTIPLVDPTFTPDGAAGLVTDGSASTLPAA